jgi:hypothetical protein
MRPGGSISGVVTQDGRNVDAGACVLATPRSGSPSFMGLGLTEVFPRADRFSIPRLPSGKYAMNVFACDRGRFVNMAGDILGRASFVVVEVNSPNVTRG